MCQSSTSSGLSTNDSSKHQDPYPNASPSPPPAAIPQAPPTSISLPPIENIPLPTRSYEITSPIHRLTTSPPLTKDPSTFAALLSPEKPNADDLKQWKYGPHQVQTTRERLSIALYITSWFICSILSLFIAKHVLHTYAVNEGIFTLWLFACSCLFGLIFTKILKLHHLKPLTKPQLKAVIPLSAAFLIKEILKYASLARVSVNLVNTIRSLGPIFAVIMEYMFLSHKPPHNVIISLSPIIFGVALTSIDELHATHIKGTSTFSAAIIGLTCAIASTAINNGQNIYSKILFGHKKLDPVSLQIYLSACSLLLMTPYSITSYITHYNITTPNKPHFLAADSTVALYLISAGFINFLASQLAFNTLNKITPLSYSVANTAKRVAIAIIAIFWLGEYLSMWNGLGIAVSIVGVFVYERAARGYKEALLYRKKEEGRVHKRSGSEVINL